MSRFIQPLESRRLLTASPTSLAAELVAANTTAGMGGDLRALTAANPTLTTLATHATALKSHLDSLIGTLLSHAGTFNSAVNSLKTDLTTLLPVPTTTPSLVGDYKGTFTTKPI